MKIYTKIIIDIELGETIYEDSFEYEGDIASCKNGDSGGGDTTTTIRYDPVVEGHHHGHMDYLASFLADAIGHNPWVGYSVETIVEACARFEAGIFGVGYTLYSFPSLYDMYGKFMAGLDIDSLYDQMFENTVNASEITNLISAEAKLLDDDIEANVRPRFQTGMRDINAVMSSSFITGAAMIEDTRIKMLSKFSAELKYRIIPIALDRWKTHLEWNKNVVMNYAEIIKLYISARMDLEDHYNHSLAKKQLWPFTVLDYERATLGALQGATKTTTDVGGASGTQKAIGGALGMAAAGAMAFPANPVAGAVAGGVLGLASSLF